MNELHTAALIAVMSLVTLGLRALPFGIFSGKHRAPDWVLYLGRVLPSAALGMLVIYCYRDLQPSQDGLYQLLAGALVVLVQVLKRNTILSILCGTLFYMLLLHL